MALYTAEIETAYTVLTADTSTVLEIIGDADITAKLVEFSFSANGVSATQEPLLLRLRQITATGTGTACNEVNPSRDGKTTPQCQAKHTVTVEPTFAATVGALGSWYIHPQGGLVMVQYPLGREPVVCDGSASQGLAWVLTSASGVTPKLTGYATWAE